jgi:hypothetical protein
MPLNEIMIETLYFLPLNSPLVVMPWILRWP